MIFLSGSLNTGCSTVELLGQDSTGEVLKDAPQTAGRGLAALFLAPVLESLSKSCRSRKGESLSEQSTSPKAKGVGGLL